MPVIPDRYSTHLLIDGALRPGNGPIRAVENPTTGKILVEVHDADLADVKDSILAAGRAGRIWAEIPEWERARGLSKLSQLISERHDELASIIVDELGKPITNAREEVAGAVAFINYAVSLLITRTDEIRYTGNQSEEIWTRQRPYGVVVAIVPWNFPLALVTRKLGPALAAGNALIVKTDEKTPLSALALARIVAESDLFPPGLINILTGPGETVGRALVRSSGTDLITMTGSSGSGKAILADAAPMVKPVHLELGGKAPFIVLDDANLDEAVSDAIKSRHLNCGQVCIANERTYVHESIYNEFLDRYVASVGQLTVGDPHDVMTQVGPKVSLAELDKSLALVRSAVSQGAEVLVGGTRLPRAGYFMEPTVLGNVEDHMDVIKQEIFGPVTPVVSFKTWDEVARRANESCYGLSAYVYTKSLRAAMNVSRDLEFGEVYINRVGPEEVNGFHSGFRESGLGGDDGKYGLEGYFRKQTVYMRY